MEENETKLKMDFIQTLCSDYYGFQSFTTPLCHWVEPYSDDDRGVYWIHVDDIAHCSDNADGRTTISNTTTEEDTNVMSYNHLEILSSSRTDDGFLEKSTQQYSGQNTCMKI